MRAIWRGFLRVAKIWSYRELAEHTERLLAQIMENASADDLHRPRAHGVYLSWFSLTFGFAPEADARRLKEIINQIGINHESDF